MARKSMLDNDSKVAQSLGTLWELIRLNLLVLLCSLPVVTAGAALVALHACLIRLVRKEESYVIRDYVAAFKENLKGGTALWLIHLAFLIPMGAWFLLAEGGQEAMPRQLAYVVFPAGFAVLVLLSFSLPLQAHYQNTLLGTLEASLRLGIARLPVALVLTFIWVLPVLLLLHVPALFPVVLFLGISLPAYLCCRLYEPIFKSLDGEEKEKGPKRT